MRKLLSFLTAALLSAAAQSVVLYEYEGTSFGCFLGYANPTPEECASATHISLWLRDDNTLDKLTYSWAGVSGYWPYSHTIDRNDVPDGWTTRISEVGGRLEMDIWDARWRVFDSITGSMTYYAERPEDCFLDDTNDKCFGPMPSYYGLTWRFTNLDNWTVSYGSLPFYARLADGEARMGRDGLWEAWSTMTKVPEPVTWLLLLPFLGWLAVRRR